ncbi:hypothetical protein J2I47_18965 [Fibrella sp. HMF5335]|uniref:Uncharacterized protein n=1 Tax=Fibrella rubiginis TaxID=2817060 RepID=A0A939GKS7_9BACT|nr:hypothetical protein [Fibrella rubiginis]MBO0938640.1 hypothetical protein [Fibrella rubiginis]
MKTVSSIALPALLGLAGACKKEEPIVLLPTPFSFHIVYKQTGLPVDSGVVEIFGIKGGYLNPPKVSTQLYLGYTGKNGNVSSTIQVPSDSYATFNCYKLVKLGSRYADFSLDQVQPNLTDLKRGQENNITVALDTLK